jgi:sigma-B regulation protein RsbU (phosphoserine phosphatase)
VEARCKTVKCEIDKFVGECEQFDDITMLSVKFNAFHNDDSIITNVDSASTERVWDFISQRIKRAEIGAKLAGRAQIIVDEIYSNIQQYSGATMAQVFCNIDPKYMVLKFRDDGIPYDPLTALEPDITASVEKRAIGGLGIHLVKKMATDISYAFEDGHNILTVTMSLDA